MAALFSQEYDPWTYRGTPARPLRLRGEWKHAEHTSRFAIDANGYCWFSDYEGRPLDQVSFAMLTSVARMDGHAELAEKMEGCVEPL